MQTPPAWQSPKLKPGRKERGREGRRERENREGGVDGRRLPSPLSAQRVFLVQLQYFSILLSVYKPSLRRV